MRLHVEKRRSLGRALLRISAILSFASLGIFVQTGPPLNIVRAGIAKPLEPALYVLSIGINKYPLAPGGFSIKYAVADAEGVASAFDSPNVRRTFSTVEITTLRDDQATLSGIRLAFEHLIVKCRPEDVVVIYFGGQGRPAAVDKSGPLARNDAEYNFDVFDTVIGQNIYSAQNALTARELSLLLLSVPAQRQIVILDSAYSSLAFDALNKALNSDSIFTLRATGRKFALIGTSGISQETAELGHGILTATLLEGMGGAADTRHKGYITEADLEGFMMARLGDLAAHSGFEEQLMSYSDLRGLCLSDSSTQFPCDTEYGYDPGFGSRNNMRGLTPEEPPAVEQHASRGTDYALILASDKYDHWPRLNNPILDAQTLEEELTENFGYAKENIILRENPTEDDIFTVLTELKKRTYGPNDRLLIYVAGHGHITDSGLGFLITRETQLPAEDPYLKSGLALSSFRDAVDQLPVPHILVVLDTCYSGIFKDRKSVPAYSSQNLDTVPSLDTLVTEKMKSVSRLYISSGGLRQAYDGEPGMHSPFARTFLKTLRQYGGQEHVIDIGKLDGAVEGLCPHPFYGTFGTQQEGGDFIFIPKPDARPVADQGLDTKVPGPHCS